jgi:hypothetical protein
MRFRPALVASVASIVVGGALILAPSLGSYLLGGGDEPASATDPVSQRLAPAPEPPAPLLAPGPVEIDTGDFWSWALLDLTTGEITGAPNFDATSTTASMIKVWLAADFLRLADQNGVEPDEQRLHDLSAMIRDSENDPATQLYDELGGSESINRMIQLCGLTDSRASWRWSLTELSARDAARMGGCVADGRAAGPAWTEWLLEQMRQVRGEGDFGIREAFPPEIAAQVAIKNGFFPRPEDGLWHLNCLATAENWALAVIQRYPEPLGRDHGAEICRRVAEQLRSEQP